MLKISDAVRAIVLADPGLRTGMAQRLMNLTQVARHIQPSVEARTQKNVQVSAIAMSLSRLQSELPGLEGGPPLTLGRRITVQRGLAVFTFPNTRRCQKGLLPLQAAVRRTHGYVTISEGVREVTVIIEAAALPLVHEHVPERPSQLSTDVASLSVSLTKENLATPGVLYRLLQPLALQGVNVAEVTSTTTEFHIYIQEADVMLGLESLYAAFG